MVSTNDPELARFMKKFQNCATSEACVRSMMEDCDKTISFFLKETHQKGGAGFYSHMRNKAAGVRDFFSGYLQKSTYYIISTILASIAYFYFQFFARIDHGFIVRFPKILECTHIAIYTDIRNLLIDKVKNISQGNIEGLIGFLKQYKFVEHTLNVMRQLNIQNTKDFMKSLPHHIYQFIMFTLFHSKQRIAEAKDVGSRFIQDMSQKLIALYKYVTQNMFKRNEAEEHKTKTKYVTASRTPSRIQSPVRSQTPVQSPDAFQSAKLKSSLSRKSIHR